MARDIELLGEELKTLGIGRYGYACMSQGRIDILRPSEPERRGSMEPKPPYDLTAIVAPIIAVLEPVARDHFAAECECGKRSLGQKDPSFIDRCNEFFGRLEGEAEAAIPSDLEWLLGYAQAHPEVWYEECDDDRSDTPALAIQWVLINQLVEKINSWWRSFAEAEATKPEPQEEPKATAREMAEEILTRHKEVPLSDGDIVAHAHDCSRRGDNPTRVDPQQPDLEAPRLEWSEYYGPPCQNTEGLPDLFCAGCKDAYTPYPCDAATLAMAVLEQAESSS